MKNNLLKKINPFLKSSLIVSIFFAIDKVFAFVRQTFVARQFGLSYELDVFNAANNIPDLLSALISGGALGVALIPVLTEYFEKKQDKEKQEGWRIFSIVVNLAFIITGIIAIIIAIFANFIITKLIAPGFPPEQQMLSVELMRLDLIAIMIFSISGLVMAGLQSNKHFLFPALAPILYNVGQIFGVMILSPKEPINLFGITFPHFNMGIHGLVYGVIIGATPPSPHSTPPPLQNGLSLVPRPRSQRPQNPSTRHPAWPTRHHQILHLHVLHCPRQSCLWHGRRCRHRPQHGLVHHASARNTPRHSLCYHSPPHHL